MRVSCEAWPKQPSSGKRNKSNYNQREEEETNLLKPSRGLGKSHKRWRRRKNDNNHQPPPRASWRGRSAFQALANSSRKLLSQSLLVAAQAALVAGAGSGSSDNNAYEELLFRGSSSSSSSSSNGDQNELFKRHPSSNIEHQQRQQQLQTNVPTTNFRTAAIDLENNQQIDDKATSQQNTFSEWWSDYWSRQPFPSGYTTSSITILACFITTIIFLIVVGNLLVCIAIFTEKSLKPTQNWFIASLAVSDMLLGLVVMPFSLARELMGFWMFGPLWCDIHEAMDVLLSTASINTLCLISLDRYWSITQAVKYLKKRTPRRGALMIAFVWFFSAAVSLPPLFGWKKPSPIITVSLNSSTTGSGANSLKQLQATTTTTITPTTSSEFWLEDTAGSDKRRARAAVEELAVPLPVKTAGQNPSQQLEQLARKSLLLGTSELFLEEQQVGSLSAPSSGWFPENAYQTSPTTAEYPSCQLSDDVGYVVYSALGSFFIPCAVMVFTYIKIFKAARSRARRAISKHQTRVATGSSKGRSANKNSNLNKQPANKQQRDLEACNSLEPSEAVNCQPAPIETIQQPAAPKGKLVIVDRRKSLAPTSPLPATSDSHPPSSGRPSSGSQLGRPNTFQEMPAGKQNRNVVGDGSSLSNNSSSTITIRRRTTSGEQEEANEEDSRKAAALLKAISQVSSLQAAGEEPDEAQVWAELMVSSEGGEDDEEEMAASGDLEAGLGGQINKDAEREEKEKAELLRGLELAGSGSLNNTTNETCFMTIEEDSDMFDEQTGRTIMLIAGNASKKHSLPGVKQGQGNIVMTMLPEATPTREAAGGLDSIEQSPASGTVARSLCNSAACRARHNNNLQNNTRSASSYCGSSMTMNEDEEDDEDEEEEDGVEEDELLTDDCNGYSVSCALDQYCSNADNTCSHCQECEAAAAAGSGNNSSSRPLSRHLSIADSPLRTSTGKASNLIKKQIIESEPQSMTADDNLSLTEYRSNEEEDSSSIMGHGVLDATTPQHKPSGEKKKSLANITSGLLPSNVTNASLGAGLAAKRKSIGFRLARLGSSAPAPAANLLALASSQHQQAAGSVPGRNLKALRQNFFLKLNQLTAKSATGGGAASDRKSKMKNQSPTDAKSSAASSGTSYEQSLDCPTTSNVHSEYHHDELTNYDESEIQTSANQKQTTTTSSSAGGSPEERNSEGQNRKESAKEAAAAGNGRNSLGKQAELIEQGKQQANLRFTNQQKSPLALVEESKLQLVVGSKQPTSAGNGRANQTQASTTMTAAAASGGVATGSGASNATGNNNKAYLASDNERHKRKLAKARERRAILILGIIMAAFICSWLPFFTFYVIRALCKICRDYVPPRLEAFIFWAGYCNSAINPIIYTIFNRDFRKAFRKLLLCKR